MILATHALTGAVIGKNIQNPWIIIILSLAVHYLMDGIRHAEYFDARYAKIKDTWWKVALDLFVGAIAICFYIFFLKPDVLIIRNMAIGAFFSLLPDGVTLIYYLSGNRYFSTIKKFHALAHRYDKIPKYSPERQWNIRNSANDILISAVAIILLFI